MIEDTAPPRAESRPATGRRARGRAVARHVAAQRVYSFQASADALGELALSGARVSTSVIDLSTGASLLAIDDRVEMPTAQAGSVLLLIELAAGMSERGGRVVNPVGKIALDPVDGPGLWQHLETSAFGADDLAALVGATNDGLATNALLHRIGLQAVRARAESLGLRQIALLDQVRDFRGPDDAPQLSVGSAAEFAWLFAALARGQVVSSRASRRVISWLSRGSDLSMVAGALGLDPLTHHHADHGIRLAHTTGSAQGVRVDTGAAIGPTGAVAYAVAVQFDDSSLPDRLRVLEAMRTVGVDLLEVLKD